jgi:hypothetical protein
VLTFQISFEVNQKFKNIKKIERGISRQSQSKKIPDFLLLSFYFLCLGFDETHPN